MANRSGKWAKRLAVFLFITLVASVIYTLVRMTCPPEGERAHYRLMFVQCLLGVAVMLLPGWISKKWSVEIPSVMMIFYMIFLYGAIFLGEVRDFYYRVPHWDVILHGFSGFMLGCLSFSFVTLLNRTRRVPVSLSPIFVAVFALCFSLALGVAWEVYEYTFDGLMGLNMQKFITADGTVLQGHAALTDTMKDLMVDALGALAASGVGYVSLKYQKGWIEKWLIRKK